jgi:FtsP/CotA-like multicopper oxidase with cupredoxin domain
VKLASPKVWLFAAIILAAVSTRGVAQGTSPKTCARPDAGSIAAEPEDLHSSNGILSVDLTYRNFSGPDGQPVYCYLYKDGAQAPTLRLQPGDLLILRLKNELSTLAPSSAASKATNMSMDFDIKSAHKGNLSNDCAGGPMSPVSTNLHFHGLSIPPVCHQDDVLHTMIQPDDPPFEYRFRIPPDEPPGLYWYHPHMHGLTNVQVLGGASGALIVEGIERSYPQLAGLPERVFIIRDQELSHPNAEPVPSANMPIPPVLRDGDGEVLNTGTGTGKPAKDLSLNFVPIPYPTYTPAVIEVKPSQRQLWRVLNASAITYVDLEILIDNAPQTFGVVALDGVPTNEDGMAGNRILWENQVQLAPGGRVEFVFKGIPANGHAALITRSVDTGPAGENDPIRPLATIAASANAADSVLSLPSSPAPPLPTQQTWLGNVKPIRTRMLYFTEKPKYPNDPNSPTIFMVTVDGQTPEPYDPSNPIPNLTVHQGDVEDWIVENRTQELHAFHIHQIHFLLKQWNGIAVNEPFLRDIVNVPYWDGKSTKYPRVTLRMDFRDPNIVGTLIYHCHLLEHEDGGMMGTIRVESQPPKPAEPRP